MARALTSPPTTTRAAGAAGAPELPRTPQAPAARPHERTARARLSRRLKYLLRKTALNPYWFELVHLRRAIEALAPSAQGRLLDVGVGERPYAELFAPHVSRYVGVEYPASCENLSPGITNRVHAGLGFVDVWCDGHALPFADESFDTALSLEVLEHVPDPDRMLAEIRRVLRPGGALLVTVPFSSPQHALPYDFYRYTPQGLRAMLEHGGFRVERVAPRGNLAAVTGMYLAQWMVRSLAARSRQPDGTVSLSRWRGPLVLPCVALVQLLFAGFARLSPGDSSATLGFAAVARRPD